MASPVVINSSPNSLRLPSITPPSCCKDKKIVNSSSPGLPSPSAFVKPSLPALKSGSCAQAVPANARFGFTSAGSLWQECRIQDVAQEESKREQGLETIQNQSTEKSKRCATEKPGAPNTGKLKRPKRTGHKQEESPAKRKASLVLYLEDSACNGDLISSKTVAPTKSPPKLANEPPQHAKASTRAEHTFGVYDLGMQTQLPAATKATGKKPRKRPVKEKASADGSKPQLLQKPRKRIAKSEAVVVNSDELDSPAKDGSLQGPNIVAKPRAPKKTRAKKAAPAPAPPSNDLGLVSRQASPAAEHSVYFAHAMVAKDAVSARDDESGSKCESLNSAQPQELAAPRRAAWTPVKDTNGLNCDAQGEVAIAPAERRSPKLQLADIICEFSYVQSDIGKPQVERAASGEAATKRRRIDLADAEAAGPASRETTSVAKEPKKPASRKKLQTITSLATAAYHTLPDQTEQSTVSEFFAPCNEKNELSKAAKSSTEKVKKQRKSRKKEAYIDGDGIEIAPSKKAKKTKVKFDETDYLTKLYSPPRAAERIQQQNFLFGTSSQLAVDESAAFIRDMQAAVQASETDMNPRPEPFDSQVPSTEVNGFQMHRSPRKSKSCAKVPTAPHGTCLSLEQAHSELWCVSARDHDGGFLREAFDKDLDSGPRLEILINDAPDRPIELRPEIDRQVTAPSQSAVSEERRDGLSERCSERYHGGQMVLDPADACRGNAKAGSEPHGDVLAAGPEQVQPLAMAAGYAKPNHTVGHRSQNSETESSWMLISSDEPQLEANHERLPSDTLNPRRVNRSPPPVRAANPAAGLLNTQRSVLQPLDANTILPSFTDLQGSSPTVARVMSTGALPPKPRPPTAKPRGRMREAEIIPTDGVSLPKKRGRPPKRPVMASAPSPDAVKFKSPKAAFPASQPLQSPSGWLDIDDISDSESPVTPSPPRRPPSSSPPAALALDVAPGGSPVSRSDAVTSAAPTLKPGEPQWLSLREQMFSRISNTIKHAPRGTDPLKPSWYQKILMYDPITLEELTAWLNKGGLRIPVERQKPKVKKRGRKKRDLDGNIIDQAAGEEWEVREEHLQPWMVQKWCEDRSICCVWAGGGWGGRTRH